MLYLGRLMELGTAETVFEPAAPPLHGGAAVGRAGRRGRRAPAHPPGGRDPQPRRPAVGLRLPHPLPALHRRHLQRRGARSCARSSRATSGTATTTSTTLRELQKTRRRREAGRRRRRSKTARPPASAAATRRPSRPRGPPSRRRRSSRRRSSPEDPRRRPRADGRGARGHGARAGAARLPDEVLVRLHACGICHSDLNAIDGTAETRCPAVLGHEGAGVVERAGERAGVARAGHARRAVVDAVVRHVRRVPARPAHLCARPGRRWRPAAWPTARRACRATASPSSTTRSCRPSPSARVVPARCCVPIPDDVPFEIAALVGCAITTGTGAVWRTAGVRPGERVCVLGCGGVGLSAVLGAAAVGRGPDRRRRPRAGQARRGAATSARRRRAVGGRRRGDRGRRARRDAAAASTTRSRRPGGPRRRSPPSCPRARAAPPCSSGSRAPTPCSPLPAAVDPAHGAPRARLAVRLGAPGARLPGATRRSTAAAACRSTASSPRGCRWTRWARASSGCASGPAVRVVLDLAGSAAERAHRRGRGPPLRGRPRPAVPRRVGPGRRARAGGEPGHRARRRRAARAIAQRRRPARRRAAATAARRASTRGAPRSCARSASRSTSTAAGRGRSRSPSGTSSAARSASRCGGCWAGARSACSPTPRAASPSTPASARGASSRCATAACARSSCASPTPTGAATSSSSRRCATPSAPASS